MAPELEPVLLAPVGLLPPGAALPVPPYAWKTLGPRTGSVAVLVLSDALGWVPG
ncbi:hypothetical protein [Pseudonocardia sp.]|uniref:hypothetical protein n=1 Tax=Pseudonocardia sp. TaxID=60912 RepID=UPI002F4102BC